MPENNENDEFAEFKILEDNEIITNKKDGKLETRVIKSKWQHIFEFDDIVRHRIKDEEIP